MWWLFFSMVVYVKQHNYHYYITSLKVFFYIIYRIRINKWFYALCILFLTNLGQINTLNDLVLSMPMPLSDAQNVTALSLYTNVVVKWDYYLQSALTKNRLLMISTRSILQTWHNFLSHSLRDTCIPGETFTQSSWSAPRYSASDSM